MAENRKEMIFKALFLLVCGTASAGGSWTAIQVSQARMEVRVQALERNQGEFRGELPPMRRAILWLREIAGWDDARIAARLGIAEPTVRRHASLATGQLRARLGVW